MHHENISGVSRLRFKTWCGRLFWGLLFSSLFLFPPLVRGDWLAVTGVTVCAVIYMALPVINGNPRMAYFFARDGNTLTIIHLTGSLCVSQDEIEAYQIALPKIALLGPIFSRNYRMVGPQTGYLAIKVRGIRRAFWIPSSFVDKLITKWLKGLDGVVESDIASNRVLPITRVFEVLFVVILTYLVWFHGLIPPKNPP